MTAIISNQITSYTISIADDRSATVALTIGNDSVAVMAESPFGSFGHAWNKTGGNPIQFLRRLRFDQAMRDLRGPSFEIFDREAQEKVLRSLTLTRRRARKITAEAARWSLDELEHVCDARSLDHFWANLHHSDLCTHLFGDDIRGFSAETCPDPACVDFWDLFWVPLIARLTRDAKTAPEACEVLA